MSIEDIIKKFQLKRVNPFQGLVIDADTWRDAHNYHHNLQKLHLLTLHREGIIEGLKVVASSPADLSVNIEPGVAIDPDGNIIVVPQPQKYRLQSGRADTIYLVLQFREVPEGPYQPPEGGQPTRLLDAYKIEERDVLPSDAYIELARIDLDPNEKSVRDARNPARPGKNEINLTSRREATPATAPAQAPAVTVKETVPEKPAPPAPAPAAPAQPAITVVIGHAVLGDAPASLHLEGIKNLAGFLRYSGTGVTLAEKIPLDKDVTRCDIIYVTGNSRFEATDEQQASLAGFLEAGGTVFGEGCGEGIKEFGLAFNQLAGRLQCKLETARRGHPILSAPYLFAGVPRGAENPMLLQGGRMIYSGSDYGCAWQGGRESEALEREVIRSAFELGTNIIEYARAAKARG